MKTLPGVPQAELDIPCPGSGDATGPLSDLYGAYYTEEECVPVMTAIGAALGYAGIFNSWRKRVEAEISSLHVFSRN